MILFHSILIIFLKLAKINTSSFCDENTKNSDCLINKAKIIENKNITLKKSNIIIENTTINYNLNINSYAKLSLFSQNSLKIINSLLHIPIIEIQTNTFQIENSEISANNTVRGGLGYLLKEPNAYAAQGSSCFTEFNKKVYGNEKSLPNNTKNTWELLGSSNNNISNIHSLG